MKALKSIIAIAILSTAILSCKKTTEDIPAPAVAATAGTFTWKENGVAYTADSAHYSLCCSPTVTTIFAFHKTAAGIRKFFEININGTANGSFTIPAAGFNPCALYYANGSPNGGGGGQANAGGIIVITNYDNVNNKITGTFSAVQGPNTITEGVFTGLSKK
jgi:hypothetical protein